MSYLVPLLILLALLGTPLFAILAGLAIGGFFWTALDPGEPLTLQVLIAGMQSVVDMLRLTNPTLVPIPLFTFAGYVLAESGAPKRLVAVSRALFGWMPGGLAIVSLMACAFFTAFTGASGVTIIALGGLLFPPLLAERYPEKFSLGLLTTGGSLGLLFPPSLPLIIYAFVGGADVDKLFRAGIIPGFLLIFVLSAYAMFVAGRAQVQRTTFEWPTVGRALRAAFFEMLLPALVLGGFFSGILTVNEIAAATALYVVVVEVLIHRDVPLRALPRVMSHSMLLVGGILIIIASSLGLTNFLVDQEIPMAILAAMRDHIHSRVGFLITLNLFLLVVGALMDIFSALLVVVPLISPIALEYGVDPLHLGIIFLTNLEIGFSTPPVGINLFISSFRFGRPVISLYRASIAFILLLLGALALITFVPSLTLWLPSLM
jgi:tripartite ATP-independent transporter DctM subunit